MSKKPLPPERLHPGWVLALVALCLVALSVQLFHISGSLPYPYHIDEQAVIGPASRLLKNSAKWDRQIDPVVLRCSQH